MSLHGNVGASVHGKFYLSKIVTEVPISLTSDLFFSERELEIVERNLHTQIHEMKFHGNWSVVEVFNLPIGLRKHYYNLLIESIKEKNKDKTSIQL